MSAVMKMVLPERDSPVTPSRSVGVIMSVSMAPARCQAWRVGSSRSETGLRWTRGDLSGSP